MKTKSKVPEDFLRYLSVLVFVSVFSGSLLVSLYPKCHRAPFSFSFYYFINLILERKQPFPLWTNSGD